MSVVRIDGEPMPVEVDLAETALIVIDMQKDFLCRGGFGEFLGNDPDLLQRTVEPIRPVADSRTPTGHDDHPHA
jgi:nicotinamidase-related amidase